MAKTTVSAAPASAPPAGGMKKRRRKTNPVVYASYIGRVLKQVHPNGVTISATAMEGINALLLDVEQRVTSKAIELVRLNKKATLGARHVQASMHLLFPPELARMAMSEGTKAVTLFNKTK